MMALGSAGSIRSLIPMGFRREKAIIMGICMSNPGSLISNYNLFPYFTASERTVFNLPVYSLADQIAKL